MNPASDHDETVIEFRGIFDVRAARSIAQQVDRAPRGAEVCVDLAKARSIDVRGVVALTQAFAGTAVRARVRLRGLSLHHLRVLRYLGTDLAQLGLGQVPG